MHKQELSTCYYFIKSLVKHSLFHQDKYYKQERFSIGSNVAQLVWSDCLTLYFLSMSKEGITWRHTIATVSLYILGLYILGLSQLYSNMNNVDIKLQKLATLRSPKFYTWVLDNQGHSAQRSRLVVLYDKFKSFVGYQSQSYISRGGFTKREYC